jgi:purine-binding chemotaxis protein CheW
LINDFKTGALQQVERGENRVTWMNVQVRESYRMSEAASINSHTQFDDQHAAESLTRWATFRLARELYGVNVMQVREVLRYTEITPVPGTAMHVLGIINLRGNVVTVIDARRLFQISVSDVTEKSRIVIVESCDQVIGVLVDCVDEVVDVKASDIDKPPNVGSEDVQRCFSGVCNLKQDLLIMIDIDQLVQDQLDLAASNIFEF